MTGKKVLVAMSGGVDSSVAALLLKNEGFETVGMTMCFGIETDHSEKVRCCGIEAINDARRVCSFLGIPHYISDYSRPLKEKVIKNFINNYLKGKTPNPCMDCNRYLKFEMLLNYSRKLGFDYFATGHYAKIMPAGSGYYLARAEDRQKDQSYFLYVIKRENLGYIKLPLGEYKKSSVRKIALDAGLPVAYKGESQDICFLDNDYRDFIKALKPGYSMPGRIIDKKGDVLGEHKGIAYYTIGQRKGLGISHKEPLYVTDIDAANNLVVVGNNEELRSPGFITRDNNILVDNIPEIAKVKIRYQHAEVPCRIKILKNSAKVSFTEPQEAVSPGQSAVFYEGDKVLGGGIISKKLKY